MSAILAILIFAGTGACIYIFSSAHIKEKHYKESRMICPHCKEDIRNTSKICKYCEKKIESITGSGGD